MGKQMLHQWGEADAERVKTCQRPGCGVQCTPSIGMLRSFGYRRTPTSRWQVGMIHCAGTDATETQG